VPFAERILGAFPDINFTIEDVFGAADRVAVRWSATMTHTGDHLGTPATGKPVRITGITVVRIANNKIVEGWDN
jgi:predicted ester cyclase